MPIRSSITSGRMRRPPSQTAFLFLMVFLFAIPASMAQSWQWARSAANARAYAAAADAAGNVYVGGAYSGTATAFGATALIDSGGDDVFLVKYDPLGNVLWARRAGGVYNDEITAVAADAAGNVYITGSCVSSYATFGTITLNSAAKFLVKYDSSGNAVWAKNIGTGVNTTTSVTVDGAGNIYLTGVFISDSLILDSLVIHGSGDNSIFIAKYDPAGNILWASNPVVSGYECIPFSVCTDGAGNIYLAGSFNGIVRSSMDTVEYYGSAGTALLVKYGSAGNIIWAKCADSVAASRGYSVTNDTHGNVYMAGKFQDSAITFGSIILHAAGAGDTICGYMVKYDSAGNVKWAISPAGLSDHESVVLCDAPGNVYYSGSFYSPTLMIGGTTLTNAGSGENIFLAKYDSAGNAQWAHSYGGSDSDFAFTLAKDAEDNIYMAGQFSSSSIMFGAMSLSGAAGNTEMFLAKLDTLYTNAVPALAASTKNISLYPNPNNGQMTVTLPQAGYSSLQVYNCIGSLVYIAALTGTETSKEIDMRGIPPGVYYVHAVNGKGGEHVGFVVD